MGSRVDSSGELPEAQPDNLEKIADLVNECATGPPSWREQLATHLATGLPTGEVPAAKPEDDDKDTTKTPVDEAKDATAAKPDSGEDAATLKKDELTNDALLDVLSEPAAKVQRAELDRRTRAASKSAH